MKSIYYPEDDILALIFSNKVISRETSQDWNVSYAADNSIVKISHVDTSLELLRNFLVAGQNAAITGQADTQYFSALRNAVSMRLLKQT